MHFIAFFSINKPHQLLLSTKYLQDRLILGVRKHITVLLTIAFGHRLKFITITQF